MAHIERDRITDPLVRRALDGHSLTFTPEDPTPESMIGFSAPIGREHKAQVKLGDAAFHPALQAADIVVSTNSKVPPPKNYRPSGYRRRGVDF